MDQKVDAARLAARLPDHGVILRGRQAMTLRFVANERSRPC